MQRSHNSKSRNLKVPTWSSVRTNNHNNHNNTCLFNWQRYYNIKKSLFVWLVWSSLGQLPDSFELEAAPWCWTSRPFVVATAPKPPVASTVQARFAGKIGNSWLTPVFFQRWTLFFFLLLLLLLLKFQHQHSWSFAWIARHQDPEDQVHSRQRRHFCGGHLEGWCQETGVGQGVDMLASTKSQGELVKTWDVCVWDILWIWGHVTVPEL